MFRNLARQMAWFIKSYRREYTLGASLLLVNYGLNLIPPYMVGYLADRIVAGDITLNIFLWILGGLFTLIGLLYLANYVWMYLVFKGGDVVSRDIRRRMVWKYLTQSPIFFARNSTGSLMGKATNDVTSLEELAGFGVMSLFDATIYPLALIAVMAFSLSLPLTLAAVVPLPFLIFLSKVVGSHLYRRYDEAQEAFDEMNERVLENIAGIRVVRAYAREDYACEDFSHSARNLYNKEMRVVRLNALFPPMSRVIPSISYLIALAMGAWLMGRNQLTTGQLITFIFYLNMLTYPMFAVGELFNVAQSGTASMERIQELLDYPEDVVDQAGALPYPGQGELIFDRFSFSYPDTDRTVLRDISFRLQPGQTLGVVGKIGSGKTTLLKQLLRFYPLHGSSGTIRLANRPLDSYRTADLREAIGYVPQSHILFSRTIEENIRLGASRNPEQDLSVEDAIELADFQKDLVQLPEGLQTLAGEKGIALSGGQKQRISIARALLRNPEILILDDSLSAVDATTEARVLEAIRSVRSGKTTLISSHRLSAVMHADHILVLDDGAVVDQGTHDTLMAGDNWYREQFLKQQLEMNAAVEVDHG